MKSGQRARCQYCCDVLIFTGNCPRYVTKQRTLANRTHRESRESTCFIIKRFHIKLATAVQFSGVKQKLKRDEQRGN
ncbi:jg10049 [Pararge aegeria aegeria]|uniref:Jg10049 protein n=1 Tax=Pararge aegeria aegeria TaxID=348720 RepID=A0A8S4S8T2_9NEOP|nr:jg10049 [Pararge aegeria aegeria]